MTLPELKFIGAAIVGALLGVILASAAREAVQLGSDSSLLEEPVAFLAFLLAGASGGLLCGVVSVALGFALGEWWAHFVGRARPLK